MAVDACRARRPKGKFAKISYLWLKVLLINWTLSCHRMGPLRATCASGCAGAVMAAAVRHPPSPLPHLWYLVYTSNNVKEFNAHIQFTDKTVYPTFQNFLSFLIGLFPASFSWLAEQEHSSMNFFLVANILKDPFCDLLDSRDCHLERRKFVNLLTFPVRWDLIPLQFHLEPGGLPCQTP